MSVASDGGAHWGEDGVVRVQQQGLHEQVLLAHELGLALRHLVCRREGCERVDTRPTSQVVDGA